MHFKVHHIVIFLGTEQSIERVLDVRQPEPFKFNIEMRVHDRILQPGQEQGRQTRQDRDKVGPGEHVQPERLVGQ